MREKIYNHETRKKNLTTGCYRHKNADPCKPNQEPTMHKTLLTAALLALAAGAHAARTHQ